MLPSPFQPMWWDLTIHPQPPWRPRVFAETSPSNSNTICDCDSLNLPLVDIVRFDTLCIAVSLTILKCVYLEKKKKKSNKGFLVSNSRVVFKLKSIQ